MKEEIFDAIEKLSQEKAEGFIRKDGPKGKEYCVYSHQTGKNFGCYASKKEAQDRLQEIHKFSKK